VAYLNGSKVLTTGSALVFDGTNLGLGVAPSAWYSNRTALNIGNTVSAISGNSQLELRSNAYLNTSAVETYINSYFANKYIMSGGTHAWFNAASGTAGNAITFTQAMTLDASGNLGVGTTSPGYSLEVVGAQINPDTSVYASTIVRSTTAYNATPRAGIIFSVKYNAGGTYGVGSSIQGYKENSTDGDFGQGILFTTQANGAAPGERARIDSSGNLLVGQTSLSQTTVGFSVTPSGVVSTAMAASTSAANSYHLYSTGAGAYRFYVGLGGTINATSTTITGISDLRLKENIRDLDEGLDVVMALKPRKFDWKEGKGADIKNARGFIAQEFETVLPDMIEEWLDPAPEGEEPYKAVNANLIPTLVKAIQEQQALITQLQADVAALKGA
jgi:hypothetical protein